MLHYRVFMQNSSLTHNYEVRKTLKSVKRSITFIFNVLSETGSGIHIFVSF